MSWFKVALLLTVMANYAFAGGGGVINLITGEKVERRWLSLGHATVSTDSWVTLQSESSFVASGPTSTVVLLSLPDLGGTLATDGIPTATRIRNVVYTAATGRVTFDAKIFVPNDTFCLKTWYNPTHLFNQQISFLVAEKGVYLLDDQYTFVVSTGQLNRTTSNLLNRSNWFYFSFPRGCGGNYAVPCSFPTTQLVSKIGAIATIQSLVFDTYLLLRVFTTQRTRIGMILTPHDSLTPSYFSSFNNYVTAGYVAFPTGIVLTCVEGVQFETASFSEITSTYFEFNFNKNNTYSSPPYVFGMLVTQNSLTDSTSIRVFDRTNTGARVITQEDQCASEQVLHTTPERATMFIFSLITPGNGIYCFTNDDPTSIPTRAPTMVPTRTPTSIPTAFPTLIPSPIPTCAPTLTPTVSSLAPTCAPTSNPTFAPTAAPTTIPTLAHTVLPTLDGAMCYDIVAWDFFGDGWDNQVLEIKNLQNMSLSRSYELDCNCRKITYCFHNIASTGGNISIVPMDPVKVVRHGWEAHWTFVDRFGVIYVGNQFSVLNIWKGAVTCYNCVDYSLDNKHNQCDRCEHPPPPVKKTDPVKPAGGKGNNTRRLDEVISEERLLSIVEVGETTASSIDSAGNGTGPGGPGGGAGSVKPKLPPLKLPFVLIDETTSIRGWYDGTGSTMDICGLPVPTVLTYPKYYISNAARTKLIHSGTICGPHSPEKCQEVLPYDGNFVWRVGGYDANPDDIQWHFCSVNGGFGQELSFTMQNGKCIPGDMIDSSNYCNGIVTLAVFIGQLQVNVLTVDNQLSLAETRTLETKLSETLFLNSKVAINSYEKGASGDHFFLMTFTVTVRMEEVSNFVGTVDGQLDEFSKALNTIASERITSGILLVSLQDTVSADPRLMSSQLSGAYGIILVSLELDHHDLEVRNKVLERPVVEQKAVVEVISQDESLSTLGYAALALSAVVFAVVLAFAFAVASMKCRVHTNPPFYHRVVNIAAEQGISLHGDEYFTFSGNPQRS